MSENVIVDTREPGGSCAELTNRAFDALSAGGHFTLVADHDPTPLRYMLDAERPGQARWTPVQEGPELWRVEVGRAE